MNPKDFDSNKDRNSSKGFDLEFDFKYPKKLHKLHNNYPLSPGKIEIKKEMSANQWKIADFIINWCLSIFIKKYVLHYKKL